MAFGRVGVDSHEGTEEFFQSGSEQGYNVGVGNPLSEDVGRAQYLCVWWALASVG